MNQVNSISNFLAPSPVFSGPVISECLELINFSYDEDSLSSQSITYLYTKLFKSRVCQILINGKMRDFPRVIKNLIEMPLMHDIVSFKFVVKIGGTNVINILEALSDKLTGATSLMMVAVAGHLRVIKLLLGGDANLDVQAKDGRTALMAAAYNGHFEAARLLVDAHANLDLQDESGVTALMAAVYKGHFEAVRLLVDAHANLDLQDENGGTALMAAAQDNNLEIARLLVDAHANLDLQDENGGTALLGAVQNGHLQIIKLLKEAIAKKRRIKGEL